MFEDLYEACGVAKEPLRYPSVVTVLDYVKPSHDGAVREPRETLGLTCDNFTCSCDPSATTTCTS